MSKREKLASKILNGYSDNNIRFHELCNLLLRLDFKIRIKGSHHIFYKSGIEEIINIQPMGSKAKPYQVKQVRLLFVKYKFFPAL